MEIAYMVVLQLTSTVLAVVTGYFVSQSCALRNMRKTIMKKTGEMIENITPENSAKIAGRLEVTGELLDYYRTPFSKK